MTKLTDTRKLNIARAALNMVLALAAVLPMMRLIYQRIGFSYEVNDDSALVQILDGSYTGTPDGHSIFVHYPLSGIIAKLYAANPTIDLLGIHIENANWYIVTFVVVTTVALVAVLFRVLCYVGRFRIALCVMFDLTFIYAWLPHFANMTFSTAAGFMAAMGVVYFGLLRKEEAWRPWNVVTFAFIMVCAYSYREPCFLMALPFIGMETVIKFGTGFFKSWKPWACVVLAAVLICGAMKYDDSMYGSDEWQQYREYNKMRAHLTDYVGFPDYEANRAFYDSIEMNENEYFAMTHYTYSMVEGYGQDDIRAVYEYQAKQETDQPLRQRLINAKADAIEYFTDASDCQPWMIKGAWAFWIGALLLLQLSVIWFYKDFRRRVWGHLANLIALVGSAGILAVEWLYLAADGRFPDRVEEVIRIVTMYVGMYVVLRILGMWAPGAYAKDDDDACLAARGGGEAGSREHDAERVVPLWKRVFGSKAGAVAAGIFTVAEIALLVFVMNSGCFADRVDEVAAAQEARLANKTNKVAVIEYCGEHPENLYVLDTLSVTDGNYPCDDTHQGNWFMSGSWMNFSPMYDKKLEAAGTDTLSREFLTRDNVYVITRGEKNLAKRMGYMDKHAIAKTIVQRFTVPSGNEYVVYKVIE